MRASWVAVAAVIVARRLHGRVSPDRRAPDTGAGGAGVADPPGTPAGTVPPKSSFQFSAKVFEGLALAILTMVLGGIGWNLYVNSNESPIARPSNDFMIEITGKSPENLFTWPLRDSVGPLKVKSVQLNENPIFGSKSVGTELWGSVTFDRDVVGDAPIRIAIGFGVRDTPGPMTCTPGWQSPKGQPPCQIERHPAWYNPNGVTGYSGMEMTLETNRFLTVPAVSDDATDTPSSRVGSRNTVSFSFNISPIPSVGSVRSRTRIEVRLPAVQVGFEGMPASPSGRFYSEYPITVKTSKTIPDAQSMTWSRTQPSDSIGDKVTWTYPIGGPEGLTQPEGTSGVREDLVSENGRRTFIAGVILGAAAGTAIPALQQTIQGGVGIAATLRDRRRKPQR